MQASSAEAGSESDPVEQKLDSLDVVIRDAQRDEARFDTGRWDLFPANPSYRWNGGSRDDRYNFEGNQTQRLNLEVVRSGRWWRRRESNLRVLSFFQ